jgi:hypothetical protein
MTTNQGTAMEEIKLPSIGRFGFGPRGKGAREFTFRDFNKFSLDLEAGTLTASLDGVETVWRLEDIEQVLVSAAGVTAPSRPQYAPA